VVLFDDFLGDPAPLLAYLDRAAGLGVQGALMQVLDPDEEGFPYGGAVLFRSAAGALRHDTRDAGGLRAAYLARLAERRELLGRAALAAGWHFGTHDTASPPAQAALWLWSMLEG
jgi:MoxR-like ATPase